MIDRTFDIIYKDIAKPRVTITPTRITLKIPTSIPDDTSKLLIDFSISIANHFSQITQTYRGQFESHAGFQVVDMHIGRYPKSTTLTRFKYTDGTISIVRTPTI